MPEAVVALSAALSTALLIIPVLSGLRRWQVVDVPNARSSHERVTPRGGGVAVILGLLVGSVAERGSALLWVLLALATIAALVGLADDLRGLSAHLRLAVQLVLGVAVVAVVHEASGLPALWMAGVAIIGVVGYVNAFNFMDGVNGISGLSGAVAGGWFALLGHAESDQVLLVGGLSLLGACVGFLPWNLPRARLFLGDVGSYGLGLFIAALVVQALAAGVSWVEVLAPLSVYLADTATTLAKRLLRGDSWREAHREHVYQRLCDAGFGHSLSASTAAGVAALVCACFHWMPIGPALASAAILLASYLALPEVMSTRRARS